MFPFHEENGKEPVNEIKDTFSLKYSKLFLFNLKIKEFGLNIS
jgi:hypothetical protein